MNIKRHWWVTKSSVRGYFLVFLAAVLVISATQSDLSAQIIVNPGQTPLDLAQKLAGKGITIINPVLDCASRANGIFTATRSNLGLDSGILLTTGCARTTIGQYGVDGNALALASSVNLTNGDTSLNKLSGQTTIDACILEFDLIPQGDTVSVRYVFSSEEYKNAVCGPYNDVFAFFISGPGITGAENIALVPGTNIPVTINTINNGIPGTAGSLVNCTSMGMGSPFTAYFVNNVGGTTLTHHGLTTVLKAKHSVTLVAGITSR